MKSNIVPYSILVRELEKLPCNDPAYWAFAEFISRPRTVEDLLEYDRHWAEGIPLAYDLPPHIAEEFRRRTGYFSVWRDGEKIACGGSGWRYNFQTGRIMEGE